jgi:hypothetical protein
VKAAVSDKTTTPFLAQGSYVMLVLARRARVATKFMMPRKRRFSSATPLPWNRSASERFAILRIAVMAHSVRGLSHRVTGK